MVCVCVITHCHACSAFMWLEGSELWSSQLNSKSFIHRAISSGPISVLSYALEWPIVAHSSVREIPPRF